MSSTVSYDDAIEMLQSMFETWDKETLVEIFRGNDCHMERTIECILSMEGGGDIDPPPSANAAPAPTAANVNDSLLDYGYDSDPVLPIPPSATSRNIEQQVPENNISNNRGVRIILPDDFLRPPGYSQMIGDEQLALMLQDEMFRKEVMSSMGPNGVPLPPTQRRAQVPPVGPGTPGHGPPDVGDAIVKGIQNMGDEMKKQLSALAMRFNASGNSSTTASHRYGADAGSSTNPMSSAEHQPLTGIYEEEEDIDSSDVINFDSPTSGRGGHSLNDDYPERNNRYDQYAGAAAKNVAVGGSKKDK
mmetsp:Transcript_5563/g.5747  ORF Transcript_5563/g.5747 Transcript_5563/m.5747 type:complete len:303 (-) Transcript_5563:278-1186(-)|eukprot:CAMPEP_0182436986 /NCGR_PEP_ID=MMETSP1167-20130531/84729_1 /TAXON_ID=2988 /ORGANISM="Mallomonas Sp, Strain CCMP3275" /LENGTH=302 /DNA_ID=CAMNT_0024629729 /DNA_START=129 /DNA_END=1037 /DNA_ORIENTATION=-